jgi:hypothetical protein
MDASNGNPMPISGFPIAKALTFRSAMWKKETPVMEINRILRHWYFHNQWNGAIHSKCLIDCEGTRLNLVFGIKRFTTEVLKNQIYHELIIAQNER